MQNVQPDESPLWSHLDVNGVLRPALKSEMFNFSEMV